METALRSVRFGYAGISDLSKELERERLNEEDRLASAFRGRH